MAEAASSAKIAPWAGTPDVQRPAVPQKFPWKKLMPVVGPLVLFVVWDLVVRFGLIKAILLPTPLDTLMALVTGLAGGPLLTDFAVTVMRTLGAFVIAAALGVPLGSLLISDVNEAPPGIS